jgi:hypothetical protein
MMNELAYGKIPLNNRTDGLVLGFDDASSLSKQVRRMGESQI